MQTLAEDPKVTFASCLSLKCRLKGTKKAKEDRQFRGVLALAYSRDRAYTLWLIMPVSDQGQLAALPLTFQKKAMTLRWKHSEKRPAGHRDKVPSVPVSCNRGWFESCSCWFLESASEVKQRKNADKLKSLVHYIVFCGKQNILLWGHPNEKVNQTTVSRLSSASDGPGMVLLTRKQDVQGISLLCLSFKPKLMMLLYWGIFIAILIREENKSSIFHPRSRMSWLTAEEKPLLCRLALVEGGGGGGSISIKYNNVFVPLSGTIPHSLRVSVSLLSEILPTIKFEQSCQKICAQCQLRTLHRCVRLRPCAVWAQNPNWDLQ